MSDEMDITLSPDQQRASDIVISRICSGHQVTSLAGAAGTGKTTLVRWITRELVDRGFFLSYAAPTGKAAMRLSHVLGAPVSTLHSLLYRRVQESSDGLPIFLDPRETLAESDRAVLVVDEASMVSASLGADLHRAAGRRTQILYVGDHAQLLPVADRSTIDLSNADAMLTQVHRQALDNPILAVATGVRQGERLPMGTVGDSYERRSGSIMDASAWLHEHLTAGRDAVVLCSRNYLREKVNRTVRHLLGIADQPLVSGEQLVVMLNNKLLGRMNGEVITVSSVRSLGPKLDELGLYCVKVDDDHYLLCRDAIGKEVHEFKRQAALIDKVHPTGAMLHVDYGYALTIHRAQGSEWDHVCVVTDKKTKRQFMTTSDGGSASRRIAYTAITRAKKSVLVLDVP